MAPQVSILMPFRNAGVHFAACLDSISAQSCTDYELLAVDDGSTDESAGLVAARARNDSRIRLLSLPQVGIVHALNRGLAEVRAPLVARMDADDLMHEQRLELQIECFRQQPDLVLAASRVEGFPSAELDRGMLEYLRWQNSCLSRAEIACQRYVESPLCHPSVTFAHAPVVAAGGYRDGVFPEDYELWLRLLALGCPMYKLSSKLLHWRQSPRSLSKIDPRYDRTAFDRLRACYLARDPRLANSRPIVIWGAGRRTRKRCNGLLEQGFSLTAWIDVDPKKIGQRINGVFVHDPDWLARWSGRQRPLVLVYVGSHGAREHIATALEDMGYRSGEDYLLVG